MNPKHLNEAQELLFYAYRAFTAAPDALLDERGWNRVHHRLLHFINRDPGISVNGLLEKLGVSKQAVHGPLKALVDAGLVQSMADEEDRRVKCLTLTPAGEQLEAALSGPQYALLNEVFDTAGAQAVAGWQTVMRALAASALADVA
ncbi:MarR family winged helix-turn-helix transcriptional regulator [Amantichitinum ursilacus]|uniref:MarR family protein n=1 Tax=Amantichitinum ursilacus TaxID=857265 RepID=A0A0N0GQH8_9NEIS|nr:MarR family transcriptional regulator [Amantichitinum ursilacus]KPC54703.1 MarR family protein [Amantichitinum ursilacus]